MVLFRAAFWIAVVIVLVPPAESMMSKDRSSGAAMLAGFQTSVLTSLTRVKADLKAQRSRSMPGAKASIR
jgi:hypothetical protein